MVHAINIAFIISEKKSASFTVLRDIPKMFVTQNVVVDDKSKNESLTLRFPLFLIFFLW